MRVKSLTPIRRLNNRGSVVRGKSFDLVRNCRKSDSGFSSLFHHQRKDREGCPARGGPLCLCACRSLGNRSPVRSRTGGRVGQGTVPMDCSLPARRLAPASASAPCKGDSRHSPAGTTPSGATTAGPPRPPAGQPAVNPFRVPPAPLADTGGHRLPYPAPAIRHRPSCRGDRHP